MNRKNGPQVAGKSAADRLVEMVKIECGYNRIGENIKVSPLQIAVVLSALADHTTLMAATAYDQRSLEARRNNTEDVDDFWPIETSVGRFLQDTSHQIEEKYR